MSKTNSARLSPLTVFLTWLALEILFFASSPRSYATEIYRYIEKTGSQTSSFQWQLEIDSEQMATITAREEKVLYVNVCDTSGATRKWRMEKKDAKVSVQRRGNKLHIQGRREGETLDETITLDDSPWFQPLSYSLRSSLVTVGKQEQIFWMIRPDKLKPQKFQAVKVGVEEISIGTGSYRAVKVKISPTGILSCLWHAYYWFRKVDGLFLRYEGTHGPPGTPKTIISLAPQATARN